MPDQLCLTYQWSPSKNPKTQQSSSTVQAEKNRGTLSIKHAISNINYLYALYGEYFFYIILKYEPTEKSFDLEMYNQEKIAYT